ncbi:craniofacial development protein 2-like [Elysia marginata]|uniref:Craniofacial development protein 2-like n=1 Tax=Elysia marginata TaxID=1093978 RepID=A0AAV4F6F7_9GAST|nr:craniofacial development protein 2-like [Elysia marginata]
MRSLPAAGYITRSMYRDKWIKPPTQGAPCNFLTSQFWPAKLVWQKAGLHPGFSPLNIDQDSLQQQDSNPGPLAPKSERLPLHHDATLFYAENSNHIDYVLIQSRFRNAVLSAKTMPGADCGSDHNPVICKVHARLKALKKPKHQVKYNLKALNKDPDLRNKFAIKVKNKFEALEAGKAEERQWEILKDSIEKHAYF